MSNPQHSSDAPRGKRRFSWKPFLIKTGVAVAGAGVCAAVLLGLALALAWPSLPDLHAMTDYRPRVPLRIYTADKVLIGEYVKNTATCCASMKFRSHAQCRAVGRGRPFLPPRRRGLDGRGARDPDQRGQGLQEPGRQHTITMQVARNFYLSSEKTYSRKFYELLLTFKIESELSKDEILALYMNQIYLGHRAYASRPPRAPTWASRCRK